MIYNSKSNALKISIITIMAYIILSINFHFVIGETIDVPGDYSTIQEAINAAYNGDTLVVSEGLYEGHIVVNKTVSIIGGPDCVVDGSQGPSYIGFEPDLAQYNSITVLSDNVTIKGISIINGANYGIEIMANNCIIRDNVLQNGGIALTANSGNNIIYNNTIRNCHVGIKLAKSHDNVVTLNSLNRNRYMGLYIYSGASYNLIIKNTISNSYKTQMNEGGYGIGIGTYAHHNTIIYNDICGNIAEGLRIELFGLGFPLPYNNTIYLNNFIDNTPQAHEGGIEDLWFYNYWSDYEGSDLNDDGLGDTNLPHQGVDYFPLTTEINIRKDDTINSSIGIVLGTPHEAIISPYGDYDYYWFNASSSNYTIFTTGYTDTCLFLYDTDGATILVADDDSGEGFNALLSWECLTPGRYYIKVTGYDLREIGQYNITVENSDLFNVSGRVYYSTTPLDIVSLELIGFNAPYTMYQTQNTSLGYFNFENVAPGSYYILAYGPNIEYPPYCLFYLEVGFGNATRDIYIPKSMTILDPENNTVVNTIFPTITWLEIPEADNYTISIYKQETGELLESGYSTLTNYSVNIELTPSTNYRIIIDAGNINENWVGTSPYHVFSVNEKPLEYHTLNVSTIGGGTTHPYKDTHILREGTIAAVYAFNELGWTLSRWLLNGMPVGSENPYYITLNQDHNLTAVFNLSKAPDNWFMFRKDLNHTGHSSWAAPENDNIMWSFPTEDYIWSSAAIYDGKVYIGSADRNLYCLSENSGSLIWSKYIGIIISSPAVVDDRVYVGSCDNKMYCLDANTGDKIWSYTTGHYVYSSPAVAYGKVLFGSMDWKLYCLNAYSGELIWSYGPIGAVQSSPAIDNERVFVGSGNSDFYCFNISTGKLLWSYPTGAVSSGPALAYGKVFIGTQNDRIYCLNATTGTHIWTYTTGDFVFSSPAISNGKVYMGSADNSIYCLNASNGAYIWSFIAGDAVHSSPAISNGKLYVGSEDGYFHCLNADNGTHIWSFKTGDRVISSPAIGEGKVVVGSYDGTVYCFGATNGSYPLSLSVEGSGTTSPSPGLYLHPNGTSVMIEAIPYTGWSFKEWIGDLTGSVNPVNVTMDGNKTITATFIRDQRTLTVEIIGNGSVSQIPDQLTYVYGDKVQLNATADQGWSFIGWIGDMTGSFNPVNVTLYGNKTITATFIQGEFSINSTCSLSLSVEGSGTTSPSPGLYLYPNGTSIMIEAIPYTGWSFKEWSGDLTGSVNPVNVTMDENKTVIATFTENPIITYPLDWPMFHLNSSHMGYSNSTAPNTSRVQWEYTTGDIIESSPIVVDGRVYIGSDDNTVYCLEASSGMCIWSYTTNNSVVATPAFYKGKVYVASCDFRIYCLNASSGVHIWNYTTGSCIFSSPTVYEDKIYFGSEDRSVYCLDAITGDIIWNYTTQNDICISSPAVVDEKVYIGSLDGTLYCLNASTGELVWGYSTDYGIDSSPAVAYGNVYFGSYNSKIYCLSADTGNLVWNYTTGHYVRSSPAVYDGKIYIGSSDDYLYCLNAFSGTEIWKFKASNSVFSSPALADGKVYVGSDSGILYCLDALTGSQIWSDPHSTARSSPAIYDGKVYVGANDYKIYCYESFPRDFTLALGVSGLGSLSPLLGLHTYQEGTVILIEATPHSGWNFSGWSGDLIGNVNPVNVTMGDNKTIIATFIKSSHYIYASAGMGGYITPSGKVAIQENETQVFTITPEAGYYIQEVIVNGTSFGAISSYMFVNVTGNQTIAVSFAQPASPPPPPPPPNETPITEAGADQTVYRDRITYFDGSNSYDLDGQISSYIWVFGDGTSATGQTVSHTYSAAGTFFITLIAIDDLGATSNDTLTIHVIELPMEPLTGIDVRIEANQTDYIVDAIEEANTTLLVNTTDNVVITVISFPDNPYPETPLPINTLSTVIDIAINNLDALSWPIYIERHYSEAEVYNKNESNLRLYYYASDEWHQCSETGVDPEQNFVWAKMYKNELTGSPIVICELPTPANFIFSGLHVNNTEVNPGEFVEISVTVTNEGDESGNYSVYLHINDVAEDCYEIFLVGGASKNISFSVCKNVKGAYVINVEGMTGIFTVETSPPYTPLFKLSNLSLNASHVKPHEKIQGSVDVYNLGNASGSYSILATLDNVPIYRDTIFVENGDVKTVNFSVVSSHIGEHSVFVSNLSMKFVVEEPLIDTDSPIMSEFKVYNLIIDNQEIIEGESITISVTVINVGNQSGEYNVTFSVENNVVDTINLKLSAKEMTQVNFNTTLTEEGVHTFSVNNLHDSIIVYENTIDSNTTTSKNRNMISPGVIALIIFGCILLYVILSRTKTIP